MQFTFTPMNEEDAQVIQSWLYEEPYSVYNIGPDPEDLSELLDRRSPYYAVRNEDGELVGSFAFGTTAEVEGNDTPHLYGEDNTLTVGLGMHPDLTGKGLGLAFVNAGLDFSRQLFHPSAFRLFVLTFNQRAIRVYERAGFQRVRVFTRHNKHGAHEFLEMRKKEVDQ